MKNIALAVSMFLLVGCSPKQNNILTSAPKIEQIHPKQMYEIYVPETLQWKVIDVEDKRYFAVDVDGQLEIFKMMESAINYKKECKELLCYYGNGTCSPIETKEETKK
jgi:hypothetical protein